MPAVRPFRVVIIAGERRGEWGAYPTIEAAASVAAKLRQHGMQATVESDGDELAIVPPRADLSL